MSKLSIGVITQQYGQVCTGPGLHARNLVRSLVEDGHDVTVIAPVNQCPSEPIKFKFISVPNTSITSHTRWLPLSWKFAKAASVLEKRQKIDLWHFTDAREAFFFRTRIPVLGNINDTYSAEVHSLDYYVKRYKDGLIVGLITICSMKSTGGLGYIVISC